MKIKLSCIFILLLATSNSFAWEKTIFDTVRTTWPDGTPKEFTTRYWFTGNEKGLRPHGQHSTWYENGQLKEESYFDRAAEIGALIRWSKDGARTEEVAMVGGKRHGMYLQWHSDRSIKTLGHYKDGQKHGLWIYRSPGDDMNNPNLYTDSVHFYYEGKLAVVLKSSKLDEGHQEHSIFSTELDLWIEWEKRNTSDWINEYPWFDLGHKIDGQKNGKWIRLNNRGEIVDISYFKNGELIPFE